MEKELQEMLKEVLEGLCKSGPVTVKLSIEDKDEVLEVGFTVNCKKK